MASSNTNLLFTADGPSSAFKILRSPVLKESILPVTPFLVDTFTLIKNGKKDGVATYNLQIPIGDDDQLLFKDVVELFSNPNHGSMTRTLSLALRHGVPVQYMVEQLQKDKHSGLQSFSKAIARVLKSYIPDGTKSQSDKTCGSCGFEGIVYKEGCVTCVNCSWSKC